MASSTYTSAAHAGARLRTSDVRSHLSARARPDRLAGLSASWTFGSRSLRGIQRPAAHLHPAVRSPWRGQCRAGWRASRWPALGENPDIASAESSPLGFKVRIKSVIARPAAAAAINPTGPSARYRLASRRICRVVSPSRSAARVGVKSPILSLPYPVASEEPAFGTIS